MRFLLPWFLAFFACCPLTHATIVKYTNFAQWQAAGGPFENIGFNEVPVGSVVTTQYQSRGVTFADGNDITRDMTILTFPIDGIGLFGGWGAPQGIRMLFNAPIHSVGVHFAGGVEFVLMNDGIPIHSDTIWSIPGGINRFAGVVSTESFNEVHMIDPIDNAIYIDNLYFSVPGPGAFGVFALASLGIGSRRRMR